MFRSRLPLLAFVTLPALACANRASIDRRAGEPPQLALGSVDIYIADTGNNRVVRIKDIEGHGFSELTTAAGVALRAPMGLAGVFPGRFAPTSPPSGIPAPTPGLYIADTNNDRVVRVRDIAGNDAATFALPQGWKAKRLHVVGQFVFLPISALPGDGVRRLARLDISNPAAVPAPVVRLQTEITSPHQPSGVGFLDTGGLTMNGDLYLTTSFGVTAFPVGSFDPPPVGARDCCVDAASGNSIFHVVSGSAASSPGGLVVRDGKLWIADTMNNRILYLNDWEGRGGQTLGGPTAGSGERQFNQPAAIAVTRIGIFVVDKANNRIVRFDDMTGANWKVYRGPAGKPLSSPTDIAVDIQI